MKSRRKTDDRTLRGVSMVINSSSIMTKESVKASIVRLEGIVAVSKMPLAYGVRFIPNFFQIFWKKLFYDSIKSY